MFVVQVLQELGERVGEGGGGELAVGGEGGGWDGGSAGEGDGEGVVGRR